MEMERRDNFHSLVLKPSFLSLYTDAQNFESVLSWPHLSLILYALVTLVFCQSLEVPCYFPP